MAEDRRFRKKLTERQKRANSLVCVGLDPLIERMPSRFLEMGCAVHVALYLWMMGVIDDTEHAASMFKFQHAHWEAIPDGLGVLKMLIGYIHANHPDIPVMVDCKRGDIDRTQRLYGNTHLGLENADGMNFVGYMGKDTLMSLIDEKRPGRALVGLGRTSNKEAWVI
ncbi:MAG: orotidine 5'-phosphate decarboxylase [Patescibacteria group bacterium]|nr:orotidine 5'-phosphate decarboxylase [Patescibacteria group bacterium]MDD5121479.1 orotidine 5'-phosphate decarboxylase [Patescibacteria group bacterium]MDD5221951.1 orotidine 5'-phosphate decarboxylase [Patescibacteria group bacterium]MDD5396359.1 orotidine 5'-phosphate decarboxylase [Patescibacteria group bacterium]